MFCFVRLCPHVNVQSFFLIVIIIFVLAFYLVVCINMQTNILEIKISTGCAFERLQSEACNEFFLFRYLVSLIQKRIIPINIKLIRETPRYIYIYCMYKKKSSQIVYMHNSLKARFGNQMDQYVHKCAKCALHGPGCASQSVNTSLSSVKLPENQLIQKL